MRCTFNILAFDDSFKFKYSVSHLEELPDGDPVEGVGLLAAKHLEEHVLHVGKVRGLGRPSRPEIKPTTSTTDYLTTRMPCQYSPVI